VKLVSGNLFVFFELCGDKKLGEHNVEVYFKKENSKETTLRETFSSPSSIVR